MMKMKKGRTIEKKEGDEEEDVNMMIILRLLLLTREQLIWNAEFGGGGHRWDKEKKGK